MHLMAAKLRPRHMTTATATPVSPGANLHRLTESQPRDRLGANGRDCATAYPPALQRQCTFALS
jgi:hypothetical protein